MNNQSHPQYQSQSGWNALLAKRQPNPMLENDITADVAIIGAGYTGLAAASQWHTTAPDDKIAIIDSSEIGEGNSGRNSGFLLEISLANDANPKQLAKMDECNQLLAGTMAEISSIVGKSESNCQLVRTGTYRGAAGKQGSKSLAKYRAFLEGAKLPFEDLTRAELNERIGSNFYQSGIYSPHCYLVQPAALIRTLCQHLPKNAALYENTPALKLLKQNGSWIIKTPRGSIRTNKVIVTNNAFAKSLGFAASKLVAMYTYAGITPALDPALLNSLGSDSNWGLLPTHRLGSTLRRTSDGRMLIRCLYGYEKEIPIQRIENELKTNLSKRFKQLGPIHLEQIWGGAVGFTFNGGAVFGETQPGLFVSAGCNGGGVVKGSLFGKLLADSAQGKPIPDVARLFGQASWMPPEPLRRLGFEVISRVERFRGRAEI
ncbi:MAG: NAD(P)/FAD-dependent oxidoreductase [Pseudohongiellaceae bacterium]